MQGACYTVVALVLAMAIFHLNGLQIPLPMKIWILLGALLCAIGVYLVIMLFKQLVIRCKPFLDCKCTFCQAEDATAICFPCGHAISCGTCEAHAQSWCLQRGCPRCRQAVRQFT